MVRAHHFGSIWTIVGSLEGGSIRGGRGEMVGSWMTGKFTRKTLTLPTPPMNIPLLIHNVSLTRGYSHRT